MQQILSFHNTPTANDFHFENSNNNTPELAINRINILVGANNAGKSRFMREIMKISKYTLLDIEYRKARVAAFNHIKEMITLFNNDSISIQGKLQYNDLTIDGSFLKRELQEKLIEVSKYQDFNKDVDYITKNKVIFDGIFINGYDNLWKFSYLTYKKQPYAVEYLKSESYPQLLDIRKKVEDVGLDIKNSLNHFINSVKLDNHFHKTYIPTLRSAVTFINEKKEVFEATTTTENKNLFQSSVKYNYELDKVENLDIFTGRDLYDTILASKNSDEDVRKEFKKFEKFIGETFFGKIIEITSIYSDKHDKRHIKVAFEGEQERELHNYGDGIQTLMLLTYKLFMAQKGEWIFIEEPELNLHPALQREFLRLITENEDIKAKELRIFFTTHSNHLLDLTITGNDDISIFVFEREKAVNEVKSKSKIREVSHTDLKILHELGVHNSSVFLANCSIWVEGITDRMYVKAYLQACLAHKNEANRWKEDRHYSFFEYSGSNIVHYDFDNAEESDLIKADFIAKHVLLIADDDKNKDAKHQKFETQLGDNYLKAGVKEIEHLLSPEQLKAILPKMAFIGGKDITDKNLATIIFDDAIYQGENATYLPKYLGNVLKKQGLNIPDALQKNTTFSPKQKIKIATFACQNIKWEDLSKKAQNFTEKIYNFIKEKNEGVIN